MRNAISHALKLFALIAILPLVAISPGHSSHTEAGGLVVDTTADSGAGSFRENLSLAIDNVGADTITFDPTVFPPGNPATINANAVYEIDAPAASDPLTISALGAGVIFDFTGVTEGDAAFDFEPDGPINGLVLKNFTIQNFTSDTNHEGHGIEIGFASSVSNLDIENMTIKGNSADGLFLNADEDFSGIIESNHIRQNGGVGVHISSGTTTGLFIQKNEIVGNGAKGIDLDVNDPDVASTAFIKDNTVSGNGNTGIFIGDQETTNAIHATITQNSTFDNGGLGIDLLGFSDTGVTENDAGDTDAGANDLLNFPVLTGVGNGIVGSACVNCTIEVFLSDNDDTGHGEGKTFLGTGTADGGGSFDVDACASQGASVTATATDSLGNTSEFALNFTLPSTVSSCERPTLIQGDLDCDGNVNPRDALIAFVQQSGATQLTRQPDCPELVSFPVGASDVGTTGTTFGDVNCDSIVSTTDGIILLEHAAEVTLNPAPPGNCTPIGQPLP